VFAKQIVESDGRRSPAVCTDRNDRKLAHHRPWHVAAHLTVDI
jgi:hypothetical protein